VIGFGEWTDERNMWLYWDMWVSANLRAHRALTEAKIAKTMANMMD
jgi:hypothetical protein